MCEHLPAPPPDPSTSDAPEVPVVGFDPTLVSQNILSKAQYSSVDFDHGVCNVTGVSWDSGFPCPPTLGQFSCAGKHTYIQEHPDMISKSILHYLRCKKRNPANTSACIVVPDWSRPEPWLRLISNMTLLHTYPASTGIYSGVLGKWPVQVFADGIKLPPAPLKTALNSMHITEPVLHMTYASVIAGAPCTTLLDTGATGMFIDEAFAKEMV